MANDTGFITHCQELLGALGPVRTRRMFGGHGLYLDGHFIAIAAANVLYLKADEQTRARFEAAGCQPFGFDTADGRRTVLSYWQAPEEAMESPPLMQPWARLALGAALRAAAAKPPAKAPAQRARPAAAARTGAAANGARTAARKRPAGR